LSFLRSLSSKAFSYFEFSAPLRIEDGRILYHEVGTHRRIRFEDLITYKQDIDQKRLQALEELTREAQELDMGY
jgi:hypothetical protein